MTRASLASRFNTLQRRIEQLSALQGEEQELGDRIARLEHVLELDRVAAHARATVERAELSSSPVPFLVAFDLLPSDVYAELLNAIPPPAFFDGRVADGEELRVPLRLAPIHAVVTWSFVDEIVRSALTDVLVARFAEPLQAYVRERFPAGPPLAEWRGEITLIDGRIVRRTPGYMGAAPESRGWELLGGVLDLASDQDGEEYGSRVCTVAMPFRANRLLVCVGSPERRRYSPIPSDASAAIVRYSYEFGIGPTRHMRRRLEAPGQSV
jgi:hypothetical protein